MEHYCNAGAAISYGSSTMDILATVPPDVKDVIAHSDDVVQQIFHGSVTVYRLNPGKGYLGTSFGLELILPLILRSTNITR